MPNVLPKRDKSRAALRDRPYDQPGCQAITNVGPICGFRPDEKEKALKNQGFDLMCWRREGPLELNPDLFE
ncbi:hypothetical protein LH447_08070 [Laribacter hongkongensis]|nr:hypothetical protein [Laribacter hongkongensis]